MPVKIKKLHPAAVMPTYATPGAACFDLYAATVNGASAIGDVVYPGHPVICDTGLAFEVPPGHMLEIRSRSGLAFKAGIVAFPGTVDADFRGSVKVKLTCDYLGEDDPPHKINPGDRIAQALILPVEQVAFEWADELSDTQRGAGGFGSTGSK